MKCLFFFLLTLVGCSTQSFSKKSCHDLKECIELNAQLTGNKYLFNIEIKSEPVKSYGPVEWTKENADSLLGELLMEAGYMRLKIPNTDTFELLYARDIRYVGNIPHFTASKNNPGNLPPAVTSDWGELHYTDMNEPLLASEIARNLRPFMSRYGRVIDITNPGSLLIVDNLTNLHRILKVIKGMDVPLSVNQRVKTLERQSRRDKEDAAFHKTMMIKNSPSAGPANPTPED